MTIRVCKETRLPTRSREIEFNWLRGPPNPPGSHVHTPPAADRLPAPRAFNETQPPPSACNFLPWAICRNVLEDFCSINFGGFCRGFSWRIFLGTFSHKNEEKKSGEKIREKIRRLKNKNPRKIRSAESRP